MTRPWRMGVDVGGTFTDGVLWNEETGAVATAKVLSTPDDLGHGFLASVDRLIAESGIDPTDVTYTVHGTTVATNAVLQRRLSPTVLIVTEGFGDLLEIARQVRADPYDVFAVKPPPLVPRHKCFELRERMGAGGEVVVPLDEDSLAAIIEGLRHDNAAAVAVCLLHAYRNPAHERRVAEAVRAVLPNVALSLSSELASEFREFPRACTAIINSGVIPEMAGYLRRLDEEMERRRFSGDRLVMQSNGGVADFTHSADRPVFMIESGPAAGVVGAAHVAGELGEAHVISFDMGGTTAKVGLIEGGQPRVVHEFEIGAEANVARNWFTGAAGYPILTPAIDLIEIGAGGGSIARLDDGDKLRVGPVSAGASPGPACYGLGGDRPTVTDANLILGRLDPNYFAGGEIRLDAEAAHRAVASIAVPLGMGVVETAAGIVRIADAAMSQALRVVSVQRGQDPRNFVLVAFGGAGPLHAVSISAETGVGTVLVPPRPGIFSAFGLLFADLKHDFAVTEVTFLDAVEPGWVETALDALRSQARTLLAREDVAEERMAFEAALDVRYVGQSTYLTIGLDNGPITAESLADVRRRFNDRHEATYGYAEPNEPCELVTVRLSGLGRIRKPPLSNGSAATGATGPVPKGHRPVYFTGPAFIKCDVYDRQGFEPGMKFSGPAVIEEAESTILVHPGWTARVESFGVLRLRAGDD